MDVYSPSRGDDAWPPLLPSKLPAGSTDARAQPPVQASSPAASAPSNASLPAAPSGGAVQLETAHGAPAGGGGGGGGDAAAAAVAAQLAASGGVSVLLEALSNMPQVRGSAASSPQMVRGAVRARREDAALEALSKHAACDMGPGVSKERLPLLLAGSRPGRKRPR